MARSLQKATQQEKEETVSHQLPPIASQASAATPAPGTPQVARRRLLWLAAACAVPAAAWRMQQTAAQAPLTWHGTALGAPATLVLHHGGDADGAQKALVAMLAEVERLESMFSLFRADSWLSRLNREGQLAHAPAEFIALLQTALDMARHAGGVFDPTVQPLWKLYFNHFVVSGQTAAPPAEQLAAALSLVGWQGVKVDGDRVSLARPGMGLTLNGIAQGFITDRCSDVLQAHGFSRMLVDMGEPRALAAKPDGSGWHMGLADPRQPDRALHTVSVVNQAVATSGGYGTRLDAAGLYTHLIDPRTGRTAPAAESVTVLAPTATQADALSTALSLIPRSQTAQRLALLHTQPGCRAICIDHTGTVSELT